MRKRDLTLERPPHELRRAAAFTLVEVVIALGIFAFAFLAIIGALPVGLSAAREATNTTLLAQVVRQVTDNLQEAPFADVIAPSGVALNYTRQGYPATGANPAYFFVTATATPATETAAVLPSSVTTTNLALIKLTVTTVDHTTNYYSTVIANLGSK